MAAAIRLEIHRRGLRDAALARARELGLLGWVREEDGVLRVHAEGAPDALAALAAWAGAEPARAKVEGHEQLAVRGVPAGVFVVQEHAATARHSTSASRWTASCAPGRCRRDPRWTPR